MCDPISASVAITAAAGGFQAIQGLSAGKQKANEYNYMANLTDIQKQISTAAAQKQKEFTYDTAASASAESAKKGEELIGKQKTAMAANSIGGSVTAADIALDTQRKLQADKEAIKYNADVKAWETENNLQNELWGLDVQKGQYQYAVKNAKRAGKINAFNSLLETAGQVAGIGARVPKT